MIGDMYQEGVIASTNPNRVTWVSGTVNVSGNSPYLDNNETPGCEAPNLDCYPLTWKTIVEVMQEEGVDWQVYQDADNFDDLPMAWFKTFQDAPKDSELFIRGIQGLSLDSFYAQAANGTLPEVSYIIGPTTLSEHQPNRPIDGAFLQRKIIEAVANSPKYNKTVLMISYDETGGWGDHVEPYHSPTNTTGEWIEDPTPGIGDTFTGPGFRVPFTVVSPWTRGQLVYTGHADHNSQLLFLEEWFAARGKKVKTPSMEPWRRNHMSNLVDAFDFEHPDYSVPKLPIGVQPETDATGNVNGTAICQATFHTTRPPVPFDAAFGSVATDNVASLSENGFKAMRGMLTEGRFLVMEMGKDALTVKPNCKGKVQAAPAAVNHDDITQRWVAHVEKIGGDQFRFSSAKDGRFLKSNGRMVAPSGPKNVGDLFTVSFKPSNGYSLENNAGQFLAISEGKVVFVDDPAYFSLFSVTFDR
jgi:phospholipase C